MKVITLHGPNPGCQLCKATDVDPPEPAMCDVPTTAGPWAYLCLEHGVSHGAHNGTLGTIITWKE